MPSSNGRVPAYRLHKPSGQARVILDGEHIYLGKFGSAESREKYARLIAESSTASSTPARRESASSIVVNEVILAYWQFAKGYYVKDGRPTRTLEGLRESLRGLRKLYGRTPAADFGPKKLKAIQQEMVNSRLSRGVVNKRVGQIKRVFKWAVAEELVPATVHHGLQTVAGLRFGRTPARETEPIRPVPDLHVAAVLPFLSPHVAAMVSLQRLTGMRPGELVIMRACDIDMGGPVWTYEPSDHKGRWRGHRRQIPLGPGSQEILRPFLQGTPDAFLFSPVQSEEWRLANRPPYHGRTRKTPIYPSELRRREATKAASRRRRAKRPKRERYDTNSYRRAIKYGLLAAQKAGFSIPSWHPHQLRHNRGTEVRKLFGIEGAQVSLGHARADVTEVYAEKNYEQAMRIAERMG